MRLLKKILIFYRHMIFTKAIILIWLLTPIQINGQMVKLPLEDITQGSNLIIVGEVTDKYSRFESNNRDISTYFKIQVLEVVKGDFIDEIIITLPGGIIGENAQYVSHTPRLNSGEKVLIFLSNDHKNRPTVTGWEQGKFPIINEKIFYNGLQIIHSDFILAIKEFVLRNESGKINLENKNNNNFPNNPLSTPIINNISPLKGSALRPYAINPNDPFYPGERGTYLNIYGENFGATQGSSVVQFFEIAGYPVNAEDIIIWSDDYILCKVPGRQQGFDHASSGAFFVITNQGTSNGMQFDVSFATPNKRFSSSNVTFNVNENGTPDTEGEFLAIQSSLSTWSNINNSDHFFTYGGTTTRSPSSGDGNNDIGWIESGWPFSPTAIGITRWRYNPLYNSNQMYEADIYLNGQNYFWSTTGDPTRMDVENIATHELGHCLNLSDLYGNSDVEKTMYGYSTLAETKKRTLELDDISGVVYLYPEPFSLILKNSFEFDDENNGQLDVKNLTQSTNTISYNSPINRTVYWDNDFEVTAHEQFTVNGREYLLAGWKDNFSTPNPRILTPSGNETYSALYKYPHHSNDTEAFTNPNQRKFIKTTDQYNNTYFHMVYESMGNVWYEMSTDEGNTWQLMNDGKPLNTGGGLAKSPSIDFAPNYYYPNQVVVVFWEERLLSPTGYYIMAQYYDNDDGGFQFETIVVQDPLYHPDCTPVISCTNQRLLVAWDFGPIYYRLGSINITGNQIYWYFDPRPVSIFGEGDFYFPTIGSSKSVSPQRSFRLAWQSVNTQIMGVHLLVTNPPVNDNIAEVEPYFFGNTGYAQNYHPSISVNSNNDYRLSWIGEGPEKDEEPTKRVVTWFNNQYYKIGSYPSSHSISITNDGRNIIAYGDNYGANNKFAQIWWFQLYKNLNTTGEHTHLSNGSSLSNMYAMSFQNDNIPYSFSMSDDLGSLLKTTVTLLSSGREAIVAGDSAQFYFALGDVKINNDVVNYIETGKNPDFSNIDTLNYYLSTEQFRLTNSSQFSFAIQYGVTDSLKAAEELNDDEFVKFKLQLINANNGRIIGEYTVVTFDNENIIPYYSESFSVNTNGIGNKRVRVRFVVEENINGEYAMANIYADESILPKQNVNMISYTGSETVTEYALEQNYPNPFNPTTTIKYQIPNAGSVTVKVYDILGREIATLINENQEVGRYEVRFDASKLASGIYIYRLQVNDYVDTKKMILLK